MQNPTYLSISEISYLTGLSPSQVAGVIRGTKGQYEPEYSLLQLGIIVSERALTLRGRPQKTYKFTCNNKTLLDYIERTLSRYHRASEQ